MYKAGTECEAKVEGEGIALKPFSEITNGCCVANLEG